MYEACRTIKTAYASSDNNNEAMQKLKFSNGLKELKIDVFTFFGKF